MQLFAIEMSESKQTYIFSEYLIENVSAGWIDLQVWITKHTAVGAC